MVMNTFKSGDKEEMFEINKFYSSLSVINARPLKKTLKRDK